MSNTDNVIIRQAIAQSRQITETLEAFVALQEGPNALTDGPGDEDLTVFWAGVNKGLSEMSSVVSIATMMLSLLSTIGKPDSSEGDTNPFTLPTSFKDFNL